MSELFVSELGNGPPLLLIHGTGTDSGSFADLPPEYETRRVISFDRRGWGRSASLGDYRRTTIAEQAIEAAGILRSLAIEGAEVLGVGFGGVVAIEMAVAEPELITAATAIEPPVLGLLPAATEGISHDVEMMRAAAEEGGRRAAWELFITGGLTTIGAGAERFESVADRGPEAADTLLVEIPAVPDWPIDRERIDESGAELKIVTTSSTPPILIEAANSLAARLEHAERDFDISSPFIPE